MTNLKTQNFELQKTVATLLTDMTYDNRLEAQAMKQLITTKLAELIEAEKAGNAMLALSISNRLGQLIGSVGTSNNYLATIAAKDLSVQTYVNVFNNISVVAAASNLK